MSGSFATCITKSTQMGNKIASSFHNYVIAGLSVSLRASVMYVRFFRTFSYVRIQLTECNVLISLLVILILFLSTFVVVIRLEVTTLSLYFQSCIHYKLRKFDHSSPSSFMKFTPPKKDWPLRAWKSLSI